MVSHVLSRVAGMRPRLDGPSAGLGTRLTKRAHRLLGRRRRHGPGRHIHVVEGGVHLTRVQAGRYDQAGLHMPQGECPCEAGWILLRMVVPRTCLCLPNF